MGDAARRDIDLTRGGLLKPLLVLSLPLVVSQALQTAYNLADTFWVGRLGGDAVSALSFAWPLVFMLIGAGGGFAAAGTVLVSQHKGAGNERAVGRVTGRTVAFVTLLSVPVAVVGYLVTPLALSLVGATGAIHGMAVAYTRTLFAGIWAWLAFFMFTALLRGWGDTRTPLYLTASSVSLNVVLDPFFILGFRANPLFAWVGLGGVQADLYAATGFAGMGVPGAAAATVLARGLAALVGLGLLFSGRVGIDVRLADLHLDRDAAREIVDVGAPLAIEQSATPLTITVLTAIVALAGSAAVAGFGIGNRVIALVFLPAIALGQGTETAVGQTLGADQRGRAKYAVALSAAIVGLFMGAATVVTYVTPEPIVSLFVSGEGAAAVVAFGSSYLAIFGFSYVFSGWHRIVMGGFRGSGSTRLAMVFSLLAVWAFRVPAAYLGYVLAGDATGIWVGMAVGNAAGASVAIAYFLRGTWTEAIVDRDGPAPAD